MAKVIRMGQLGKALNNILDGIEKKEMIAADRALRKTYFERLGAVIFDTPVDKGFLQASWFLDRTYNASKVSADNGKGDDYISSQVAGKNVINEKWYFYNNQPYAYIIEYDGHSQQAPRGMLRTNLISFGRILTQNWKSERAKLQ